MRERGRRPARGGDGGYVPRRRRDGRPEPNRLADQASPNVLSGPAATKASASPSWLRQRTSRQKLQAAPAVQPAPAEARPAIPAAHNPPNWGAIIFAGFILFSLVRACLQ